MRQDFTYTDGSKGAVEIGKVNGAFTYADIPIAPPVTPPTPPPTSAIKLGYIVRGVPPPTPAEWRGIIPRDGKRDFYFDVPPGQIRIQVGASFMTQVLGISLTLWKDGKAPMTVVGNTAGATKNMSLGTSETNLTTLVLATRWFVTLTNNNPSVDINLTLVAGQY